MLLWKKQQHTIFYFPDRILSCLHGNDLQQDSGDRSAVKTSGNYRKKTVFTSKQRRTLPFLWERRYAFFPLSVPGPDPCRD